MMNPDTAELLAVLILAAIANTVVSVLVLCNMKALRVRFLLARTRAEEMNLVLQHCERLLLEQRHVVGLLTEARPKGTTDD